MAPEECGCALSSLSLTKLFFFWLLPRAGRRKEDVGEGNRERHEKNAGHIEGEIKKERKIRISKVSKFS